MSTFKDEVAKDIKAVFINSLEFADEHNINGRKMMAVIDNDILQERKSKNSSEYAEGVFKDQRLVFVSAEDFGPEPAIGELFRIDGSRYFVANCVHNMGVFEITIEANQQ